MPPRFRHRHEQAVLRHALDDALADAAKLRAALDALEQENCALRSGLTELRTFQQIA
jgi:hypothetical protein